MEGVIVHEPGPKDKVLVGVKQAARAIAEDKVLKVYVARDAEQHVTQKVIELASEKSLEIEYLVSMKELGKLCKIDVGAATAVLLK
jgi:large subunit ribosomal protein L7A